MTIKKLLDKKWTNLLENYKNLKNNDYPGVYILAYTNKNLGGKSININDIFYVGMSNSRRGIKSRLKQFIDGINKNRSHSAGMRFYKKYALGVPFNRLKRKETFFVQSLSLPCNVIKEERNAEDLRKMGKVTKLEYDLLAHIKEKTEKEPELNKK